MTILTKVGIAVCRAGFIPPRARSCRLLDRTSLGGAGVSDSWSAMSWPRSTCPRLRASARASPVRREMVARSARRITRGLRQARMNRRRRVWRSSFATTFGPCWRSRRSTSSSDSPGAELPSRSRAAAGSALATAASRGEARIERAGFGIRRRFRKESVNVMGASHRNVPPVQASAAHNALPWVEGQTE